MTSALAESRFIDLRPTLLAIAYRITGSRADAEDAVQDSWLRWSAVDQDEVDDPRGYLAVLVSRVALNQRRSRARLREDYPGPWLPEPVVDDGSPEWRVLHREGLGLALDAALSRLTPEQATAFVLHRLVGLEHSAVATAIGTTPAAARQLFSRAARAVDAGVPEQGTTSQERAAVLTRLVDALLAGDVESVTALLTEDVVVIADGGGKARSAIRPIVGLDPVSRFIVGLTRLAADDLRGVSGIVNGGPAFASLEHGRVTLVVTATTVGTPGGRKISELQLVRNPDKLAGVDRQWGDAATA